MKMPAEWPRCEKCNDTVTMVAGLPVVVSFEPGGPFVQIAVDLADAADDPDPRCWCDDGATLSDEARKQLKTVLRSLVEQVGPDRQDDYFRIEFDR